MTSALPDWRVALVLLALVYGISFALVRALFRPRSLATSAATKREPLRMPDSKRRYGKRRASLMPLGS
jgi:hypothetical protein